MLATCVQPSILVNILDFSTKVAPGKITSAIFALTSPWEPRYTTKVSRWNLVLFKSEAKRKAISYRLFGFSSDIPKSKIPTEFASKFKKLIPYQDEILCLPRWIKLGILFF